MTARAKKDVLKDETMQDEPPAPQFVYQPSPREQARL